MRQRESAPAPQALAPRRSEPTRAVANAPSSDFARRADGGTVGTTSRDGQSVFATSTPATKKAKASGKKAAATAPSSRSAAGDLWTGFKPAERSSVFAAQATAAGQDGGLSGTATAALALLGLGLTGMAVAVAFLARSRRSKAQSVAGGSGSTEM